MSNYFQLPTLSKQTPSQEEIISVEWAAWFESVVDYRLKRRSLAEQIEIAETEISKFITRRIQGNEPNHDIFLSTGIKLWKAKLKELKDELARIKQTPLV